MSGNSGLSQGVKKLKNDDELEIDLPGSLGVASGINIGQPDFNIIASYAIKSCLVNSHILANAEVANTKEKNLQRSNISDDKK